MNLLGRCAKASANAVLEDPRYHLNGYGPLQDGTLHQLQQESQVTNVHAESMQLGDQIIKSLQVGIVVGRRDGEEGRLLDLARAQLLLEVLRELGNNRQEQPIATVAHFFVMFL